VDSCTTFFCILCACRSVHHNEARYSKTNSKKEEQTNFQNGNRCFGFIEHFQNCKAYISQIESLTVIEENAANNRYLYRSQLGTFVKQITADEYTIIDKLMNLTEYSFYLPVIFKYGNSNKKLFAEFEYLMPMTSKPNCNMVIDMACDVLRALSFLHANNIIHRDVKPANIMMKQANQDQPLWFVLIDFGISVIFINGSEITMDIGTGMFKAPEVASGKPYDEKIDIYSLGATILYLLDEQQYTKQQAKAIETIKWESDILKNIIAKMVNEDPSKRPSADEALMILLDVQ